MTAEMVFKYALICGGLLILGFNVAVCVHAGRIVRAVTAWRLFIIGKSGLTAYVIVSMFDRLHDPLGYRGPLAAAAIVLTLVSLGLLHHAYKDRSEP